MKRVVWLLPVIAAACGEPGGARLEPEVRKALGWPARGHQETVAMGGASRVTDLPTDAWVSMDPCAVPAAPGGQAGAPQGNRNQVRVRSRWGARGGGGVLVRWQGGEGKRFHVRLQVLCERMDFATNLAVGLFPVGGFLEQDPALLVNFGSSGGQGDVSHLATLQACQGNPDHSSGVAFSLGQSLEVHLSGTGREAAAELRLPSRREPVARWQTQLELPAGVYLLGVAPRANNGGALEATITLVESAGDLEVVSRGAAEVPPCLRDGVLSPGVGDDLIGRVASLLNAPSNDWEATSVEARRWIHLAFSLGIEDPDLGSWLERAAVDNAGPAERRARMVGAMTSEVMGTLQRTVPVADQRRHLADFADSIGNLDELPVQLAALRMAEFFAQHPRGSSDALLAAFHHCKCDTTVFHVLDKLADDDPGWTQLRKEIVDYVLSPLSGAGLLVKLAERLADSDPETARRLCERALEGGVCGKTLLATLRRLDASDLIERWEAMRSTAPAVLRATLVRQRWMGLGAAAARTARMLLQLDPSPESARVCAPVFCLVRDLAGLAKLVADRELGEAAREGLREDIFIQAHRQTELEGVGLVMK